MVLGFRRGGGGGDDRLDRIESLVQEMLADDVHAFGLAMASLLGDRASSDVGDELRATDRRVNQAERDVRRELVVHASVTGAIDTPAVLVYMSIVKDVERIGDYAKNLFDLAADGAVISEGAAAAELRRLAVEVPAFIEAAARAFRTRDVEVARGLLRDGDVLLDAFDARVSGLVSGREQDARAVAVALANRYLKRVVAHVMNLLSAVVMPVDRIDYFDEDPEDRRD